MYTTWTFTWDLLIWSGVSSIPVLVATYGFIREPGFRYIKNGNTGIPKYPLYGYTVGVNKELRSVFIDWSFNDWIVHWQMVFYNVPLSFNFVSFRRQWTIVQWLDRWLTNAILHCSIFSSFLFRFVLLHVQLYVLLLLHFVVHVLPVRSRSQSTCRRW